MLVSLCLSATFAHINAAISHSSDLKAVFCRQAPADLTMCVARFMCDRMKASSPDNMFRPLGGKKPVHAGNIHQKLLDKLEKGHENSECRYVAGS